MNSLMCRTRDAAKPKCYNAETDSGFSTMGTDARCVRAAQSGNSAVLPSKPPVNHLKPV